MSIAMGAGARARTERGVSAMRVILRGLRLRRGKWPVAIPLYDIRACPDCAALVWGWPGQWQHAEWHAGPEEELEPEVDGYVVGQGMAPADVTIYDGGE